MLRRMPKPLSRRNAAINSISAAPVKRTDEIKKRGSPASNPPAEILAPKAPKEAFGDRYPLTDEQRASVSRDIILVRETLHEVATLMRACFGDTSQVVIRAEECSAAVQRFEWELERTDHDTPTTARLPEPSGN